MCKLKRLQHLLLMSCRDFSTKPPSKLCETWKRWDNVRICQQIFRSICCRCVSEPMCALVRVYFCRPFLFLLAVVDKDSCSTSTNTRSLICYSQCVAKKKQLFPDSNFCITCCLMSRLQKAVPPHPLSRIFSRERASPGQSLPLWCARVNTDCRKSPNQIVHTFSWKSTAFVVKMALAGDNSVHYH